MNNINQKLDIIIDKIETIEERIIILENKTNKYDQYVPFVGFLNNITKKIFTFPKFNWITAYFDINQNEKDNILKLK
jgi:hypothetical protein|tara:strand:- start:449 stop:679 length:231 start_codon:yes stop_codon:yes gene_type:complete